MLDLRTPSSPHSTSWSTTSATPSRQKEGPLRRHRSPKVKCLPWPSSPVGLASRARGIPIATHRATCAMLSPPCPIVRSSTALCVRDHLDLIEEVALHLAKVMGARKCSYQALDSSAMPVVRDAKRRGSGWLTGYADIGWSNRLGRYEGFRLLVAVDPVGVITGFGPASATDQQVAETLFAVRHQPNRRLRSAGCASSGPLS